MKFTLISSTIFLTILFDADALDLNRFFWHGDQSQTTEEIQMVEIVRWRQPVCMKPARSVSLCLEGLRKFQTDYERVIGKRLKEEEEEGYSILTDVQSKSLEQEVLSKFESPKEIVVSFPREQLQPSEESLEERSVESSQRRTSTLTEEQETKVSEEKHLPHLERAAKRKQIYVTKVLNAPVTATLVAHNCLPDVGIPLCEHQDGNTEAFESHNVRPSLSIALANTNDDEDIVELSGDTFHRISTKSIGEVDEMKPVIAAKNPNFVRPSTSFTLDCPPSATRPISRQQHAISRNVAGKPLVLNNISPCSEIVFENRSLKESSNQFAEFETNKKSSMEGETENVASRKQEISLDNVHDGNKFDLGDGKPVRAPVFSDWLKVMDNIEETPDVPKP